MDERAEQALRDALAFAESIIDTVRDPLLILGGDLRVVSASPEFYRTFGVTLEETAGRLVFELGNGQWDIPRLRTLLEEILPQSTTFRDFEVEHAFEQIGRKVMLLNARRLRRGPGEREMILLAIEDATARLDAEEARRAAETRFTEMVKNVRDHSIFLTDPDGLITSWNVAAERVIGYREAEAVGRHFSLIFTPEDVQAGLPEWELRTAREQGRAEDERWHVRKGGERFWALGIVTPLHDPDGRLTGFSKILRDITDRKRADEALRESESRLAAELAAMRRLHDLSTRLVASRDPRTALDEILDASITMHGADLGNVQVYDPQSQALEIAAQRGFRQDFLDQFRFVRSEEDTACGRAVRSGERVVIEDVQTEPGYEPFREAAAAAGYRAVQSTPLVSRQGELLGVLSTHFRQPHRPSESDLRMLDLYARQAADIIDHLRVQQALREADRRKDEFLAMLGHELRNPLAPLRGVMEALQRQKLDGDRLVRAYSIMGRQLGHLTRLVDDLLDVSRITRGLVELRKGPVDLAEVAHQAVEMVTPVVEGRGHDLNLSLPRKPLRVEGDTTRLTQVVFNLLNNAAKYTASGGKIWLTVEREGDEAVLRVRDNGSGMKADLVPKVFVLFTQAERTLDRSQGGLGLGLTLVKRLVEMHGGSVEARSEGPGKGSEFIVRLPARAAEAGKPPPARAPGPPQAAVQVGRALVVDDNFDVAESMTWMLEGLAREIKMVHSGAAALETAAGLKPEIIVCDIGMPGMDGYETCRRLRQLPGLEKAVIAAVSGYGNEEDKRKSKEAGFDRHLVKPIGRATLEELVRSAAGR